MSGLRGGMNRLGVPFGLAVALFAGSACQPDNSPQPLPSEAPSARTIPLPSCVVGFTIADGRRATFNLAVANGSEPGIYDVGSAAYDFGDGTTEFDGSPSQQPHTYAGPGVYAVRASIIMTVAPGAEFEAPFLNRQTFACTPATVNIA